MRVASAPAYIVANARIFTADVAPWASAFVVEDGRFAQVGDLESARQYAPHAEVRDLGGAVVLPGFVDAHAHVLHTGSTLTQVSMWGAGSLDEILARLHAAAAGRPTAERIVAYGWQHASVPGGVPHRDQLDEAFPDRPVIIQAYDAHSAWLNSAALAEVGIDDDTPDPHGGTIHRDASGAATGFVDEVALHQWVWGFLDRQTTDAMRDAQVDSVMAGYRENGVTGTTEMALTREGLDALLRADASGRLTAHVAAYWIVNPTGVRRDDAARVDEAIRLAATTLGDHVRIVGVKVLVDGTIDGCTAALGQPYSNGSTAEPIWSLDELAPVAIAVDGAGLSLAMHAIGDEAVRIAIGAVEAAVAANGERPRRHRIEHLEVVDRADITRMARLGVIASMQPVHADPAIQQNWREKLGDERVERGYPWAEMTSSGVRLAFGTDSPTSPFHPLANMYVATTRRSALNPALPANVPGQSVPLEEAVVHATRDAAWVVGADERYGRIATGLSADYVVLDRDIFAEPLDALRTTGVTRTVFEGSERGQPNLPLT